MTVTRSRPPVDEPQRSSGRRRATTARRVLLSYAVFALGIVLTSAGAGLALPHATKEGLTWPTALGVALLVAGVGLAGWSGWRILTGVRRRWWLLAIPLLVLTTYLGVWTVAQAVAASLPAHPADGARTPADVGLAYRDVTMTTSDGVRLAAWWVPPRNGAAVALLHGSGTTRSSVLGQAAVLARHGYGVLLVDARGHGASGGAGMDFGWYGERDAAAAVAFLVDRAHVSPRHVGLLGLSMGGESAIGAAGVDPRVHAVVAEGATNRVAADKGYLAAEYGWRGEVQQRIDWLTYATAGLLTSAPEPQPLRDAVRTGASHGTGFLLLTAGDVDTEGLAAAYLRRAAPSAVDVWTVPGAAHTGGLRTDPAGWERHVVGFLDGALLTGPRNH